VNQGTAKQVAWRPIGLVAGIAGVIHLTVATRYGWHHDEFYYVICGRHLAFGYVDQPPAAPVLARLADSVGGLFAIRLLAIAAQLACVVLTGVLAAQFGGRRTAQTLASAAVAACPMFVAASMLWGTTVLDQVIWAALFVLVMRALRENQVRWWVGAGVVAGLGFESKDTVAVLMSGIAVGVFVHRRDVLRTPGPWIALALTALLAAPNLAWDASHGWPNLTMDHVLSKQQGGTLGSLLHFPELPLLLAGPPLIALWWAGLRWLRSPEGHEHRWLVPAIAVVPAVFVLGGGKVYYAAPLLIPLFAAGAVAVPSGWSGRNIRGIAISALAAALIGLPFLPPAGSTALRVVNPELMQTYGWPQFTREVASAAATQPADVPVFTSDFGEAGSLTILGPAAGLHRPVYSGHDNYFYWGPPPGTPDSALCVGKFPPGYLNHYWNQVTEIAPITFPSGLKNMETEQHAAIYLCQQPRGSWAQLWPGLRHID
jgi:4-amino-4-deoxy-L-arabinose transferase-like glycosyltransferase